MIKDMARELTASIEELEITLMSPPDPENTRPGDIKIPEQLQLFLRNLFTTEPPMSERVHKLLKSLVQNVIYCVSRDCQTSKTVKDRQTHSAWDICQEENRI